jgi:hypothetical protein
MFDFFISTIAPILCSFAKNVLLVASAAAINWAFNQLKAKFV